MVRLDGQYGNGAIVADLAGLAYVMRGKDYELLDLPEVQARLAQPSDQQTIHPETGTCRALFDFPDLRLAPTGPRTRIIVATHQATLTKAPVDTTRGEMVYELFLRPCHYVGCLADGVHRGNAVYAPTRWYSPLSRWFPLYPQEHRPERHGSLRAVMKLLRHQRVDVELVERVETAPPAQSLPIRLVSRAERAHWRLSWAERLARNARPKTAPDVSIKLFGIPGAFATALGLCIA